jgi:hypothetical protein
VLNRNGFDEDLDLNSDGDDGMENGIPQQLPDHSMGGQIKERVKLLKQYLLFLFFLF